MDKQLETDGPEALRQVRQSRQHSPGRDPHRPDATVQGPPPQGRRSSRRQARMAPMAQGRRRPPSSRPGLPPCQRQLPHGPRRGRRHHPPGRRLRSARTPRHPWRPLRASDQDWRPRLAA
jgi:hypothetical protein